MRISTALACASCPLRIRPWAYQLMIQSDWTRADRSCSFASELRKPRSFSRCGNNSGLLMPRLKSARLWPATRAASMTAGPRNQVPPRTGTFFGPLKDWVWALWPALAQVVTGGGRNGRRLLQTASCNFIQIRLSQAPPECRAGPKASAEDISDPWYLTWTPHAFRYSPTFRELLWQCVSRQVNRENTARAHNVPDREYSIVRLDAAPTD